MTIVFYDGTTRANCERLTIVFSNGKYYIVDGAREIPITEVQYIVED